MSTGGVLCPKCETKMDVVVQLTFTISSEFYNEDIDKSTLRSAETNIMATHWAKATFFCPGCGLLTRKHDGTQ